MPEHAPDLDQFLRNWLDAKVRGDRDAVLTGLSSYPGVLAIGTDADEWWAGAEAFAAAHGGAGPLQARIEHLDTHAEGTAGWGAARVVADFGDGRLAVRVSVVAHREENGWRVVQTHASVGDPAAE
jgi:hypothetical protein